MSNRLIGFVTLAVCIAIIIITQLSFCSSETYKSGLNSRLVDAKSAGVAPRRRELRSLQQKSRGGTRLLGSSGIAATEYVFNQTYFVKPEAEAAPSRVVCPTDLQDVVSSSVALSELNWKSGKLLGGTLTVKADFHAHDGTYVPVQNLESPLCDRPRAYFFFYITLRRKNIAPVPIQKIPVGTDGVSYSIDVCSLAEKFNIAAKEEASISYSDFALTWTVYGSVAGNFTINITSTIFEPSSQHRNAIPVEAMSSNEKMIVETVGPLNEKIQALLPPQDSFFETAMTRYLSVNSKNLLVCSQAPPPGKPQKDFRTVLMYRRKSPAAELVESRAKNEELKKHIRGLKKKLDTLGTEIKVAAAERDQEVKKYNALLKQHQTCDQQLKANVTQLQGARAEILKLSTLCKTEKQQCDSELASCNVKRNGLQAQVNGLKKADKNSKKEISAKTQALKTCSEKHKKAEALVKTLKADASNAKNTIKNLNTDKKKCDDAFEKVTAEKKSFESELKLLEAEKSKCEDLVKKKEENVVELQKNVNALAATERSRTEALSKAQTNATQCHQNLKLESAQLLAVRKHLEDVNIAHSDEMKKTKTVINACQANLTQNAKALADTKQHKKRVEEQLAKETRSLDECRTQVDKLKTEVEAKEKQVTRASGALGSIKAVMSANNIPEDLKTFATQCRNNQTQLERTVRKKEKELESKQKSLDAVQSTLNDYERQLQSATNGKADFTDVVAAFQKQKQLQKDIQSCTEKSDALEEELKYFTDVITTKHVSPELNVFVDECRANRTLLLQKNEQLETQRKKQETALKEANVETHDWQEKLAAKTQQYKELEASKDGLEAALKEAKIEKRECQEKLTAQARQYSELVVSKDSLKKALNVSIAKQDECQERLAAKTQQSKDLEASKDGLGAALKEAKVEKRGCQEKLAAQAQQYSELVVEQKKRESSVSAQKKTWQANYTALLDEYNQLQVLKNRKEVSLTKALDQTVKCQTEKASLLQANQELEIARQNQNQSLENIRKELSGVAPAVQSGNVELAVKSFIDSCRSNQTRLQAAFTSMRLKYSLLEYAKDQKSETTSSSRGAPWPSTQFLQLEAAVNQLSESVSQYERRAANSTMKIQRLEKDFNTCQKDLVISKDDWKALKSVVETLEKKHKELKDLNAQQLEKVYACETQKAKCSTENGVLTENYNQAKRQLAQIEKALDLLRESSVQKETELRNNYIQAEKKLSQTEKTLADLRTESTRKETELLNESTHTAEKLSQTEKALADLRAETTQNEAQLKSNVTALEESLKKCASALATQVEETKDAEQRLSDLTTVPPERSSTTTTVMVLEVNAKPQDTKPSRGSSGNEAVSDTEKREQLAKRCNTPEAQNTEHCKNLLESSSSTSTPKTVILNKTTLEKSSQATLLPLQPGKNNVL